MKLPESRRAAHSPDPRVDWAHEFSPYLLHNHVIPEREPSIRKNMLGDHIDRSHAPEAGYVLPLEKPS